MLFIYGATAHAKMVIETAELCRYHIAGLIDKSLLIKEVLDYPVTLTLPAGASEEAEYFVAILDAGLRKRTVLDLSTTTFATLIHPQAYVSPRAEIGKGTIIMPGAVIHPDVQIGEHCIIGSNAVLHSNTIIEDFVTLGANVSIASQVLIQETATLCANAVVEQEQVLYAPEYN